MRREGFSFYIWGSGGWPVFAWPCFWRPQAFATVRNRLQPSVCGRRGLKVAVPMRKVAKTWLFWRVRRCGHVVLRGRRGTLWHSNMFHDASKVVLWGGAILLPGFHTMRSVFRGRRSTLKTSDVILHGRRKTLDVSCCVIFANRIVSAARSGDKVQIAWQAWHFVTCHEIDGSLARNVDFAVGPWENS